MLSPLHLHYEVTLFTSAVRYCPESFFVIVCFELQVCTVMIWSGCAYASLQVLNACVGGDCFQYPCSSIQYMGYSVSMGMCSPAFSAFPNVTNTIGTLVKTLLATMTSVGVILFSICSGTASNQSQGNSSWSSLFPNCATVPIEHPLKGGWRVTEYLTYNWSVCVCVCTCVCVCVCVHVHVNGLHTFTMKGG